MKNHYIQMLIGLLVGFGASLYHRGPMFLLFVGASTVSASPTANCTQFQLAPHSQKSLPGLPKLEAEAAFWKVDLATDSQHITTATLHTTATLRESSVTSVPLPAQGHFIVTLTSGTAHHPMHHDGPVLPDGTVGWSVDQVSIPSAEGGRMNSPARVIALEVVPLIWSTGRVVNVFGAPLSGVTVEGTGVFGGLVGRPHQIGTQTLTSTDGRYRVQSSVEFSDSSSEAIVGRTGIRFQKLGYTHAGSPEGRVEMELTAPVPAEVLIEDKWMGIGRVVRGRVQDERGTPVADAIVFVKGLNRAKGASSGTYFTDVRGEYVGTVRADSDALVAFGFDWNTGFATRDDPTAISLPPITLRPPRELTFELAGTLPADARRTMLDLREFSPIAYRWYRSAWASPRNPDLRVEPDLNDGDRYGFVDGVITVQAQFGSYVRARAKCRRDGLASPWLEIGPNANGAMRKTLKLEKLATVSGIVSDKAGQPVPSLKVRADGAPGDTVMSESDSNGSFTLRDIPLEATEITVGDNTTSPVRVNLPLDKSKPLHIHLDHDRRSIKPKPPAF